jgi:uncharacterized protein YcbX
MEREHADRQPSDVRRSMTSVVGTIGAIMRFPVKSLLGETLTECAITFEGLDGDRTHALVDALTGKLASAKQPNLWRHLLAYAASTITSTPLSIIISDAEGNHIPLADPNFGEKLSKLLGREVRLADVRPAGIELNRARPDEVMTQGLDASVTQDVLAIAGAAPIGGFFDFAPLHLMTTASLDAIRAAAPHASILADRYRPNLVIETLPSMAFAENHWVGRQIRIGDSVGIEVIAPTPRCAVPMLVHGSLPYSLEAVAKVSKLNQVEFPMLGPGTFPCLGAYATVLAPGPVRRGDRVVLD